MVPQSNNNASKLPKMILIEFWYVKRCIYYLEAFFGYCLRTSLKVYPAPDYASSGKFRMVNSDHRCSL